MKKYLRILLLLFVIVSVRVEAAVVQGSFSYVVPARIYPNSCIAGNKPTVSGFVGKVVNLIKEDGSNQFINFNLDVGKSVRPESYFSGGDYWKFKGPAFSENPLYYNTNLVLIDIGYGRFAYPTYLHYMSISNYLENKSLSIVSDNPGIINCINGTCTAVKEGTANLTISYGSDDSVDIKEQVQCVAGGITSNSPKIFYNYKKYFSFPSITYTVTVPPAPNTDHVSTCTGAEDITKDSATVKWSYTDADNDPQTQYQVQLSKKSFTDPTFSTSTDVVFAGSGTGTTTSHTFTGLTPNTTYYSRIKTYNATNAWSTYSTCNSSFITSKDPDVTAPTCACNKRDYVCTNTDGTTASTDIKSTQCAFETYCSVTTDATDAIFTFGPSKNRLGTKITYEHSPDILVERNDPSFIYTYKTSKIPGIIQSLTVKATDSYDDSSYTKICSITNDPITPTSPCGDSYTENQTTCPVDTELKWNCDTNTKTWKSTLTGNSCTPTTTTTKITITKTPKITLNKGGTCTLNWSITPERPAGMTCTVSGGGKSEPLPDKQSGSWPSPPIYQNTKYTIKCDGGTPPQSLSASVICRINPSVNEI